MNRVFFALNLRKKKVLMGALAGFCLLVALGCAGGTMPGSAKVLIGGLNLAAFAVGVRCAEGCEACTMRRNRRERSDWSRGCASSFCGTPGKRMAQAGAKGGQRV